MGAAEEVVRPRRGRAVPHLAALWESSVYEGLRRDAIAERVVSGRIRARMMVLAAFSRAHASRLLARLNMLGRGPLPVAPDVACVGADMAREIAVAASVARQRVERYKRAAEVARSEADLSSAWVFELNATEEADAARELARFAEEIAAQKGT